MKRNILVGGILLSAVFGWFFVFDRVSAQNEEKEMSDVSERPDSSTPQTIPFAQNWTNAALIATNDDWSGVPGVEGYLGQDITLVTGVDPQTLLTTSTVANDLDVIANGTTPDTVTSGGVGEFEITNPVVALQGSGTADAPYVTFYLNTTGFTGINVAYNLRDIDGSADNSIQPVALQYRVGNTGDFTNVPAGFVADASSGPSLATLVTSVSAALPANANNQPLVQVRVMTTNAVGSDEWIGVDDINVTGTATGGGTPTPTPTATSTPTPTPTATPTPGPLPGALPKRLFTARLSGLQEVPANNSAGTGFGRVVLNAAETQITASFYWEGLGTGTTVGHIHTGAVGANGGVTFDMAPTAGLTRGSTIDRTFNITPAQVATLRAGGMYFNIHTSGFPGGEIRGQILSTTNDAPLDFNGDGRTDFSAIRSTSALGGTQARWYNQINATNGVESQVDFGVVTDSITPGDFDGDGKDDIAVWRAETGNSRYFVLQSSTNTVRQIRFGLPGDNPFVIADYDGDGIDDPGIFRKAETDAGQSQFWWFGSFGETKNVQVVVNWGVGADSSVPGDYNGDGKADFFVYRAVGNRGVAFIHYGTGGFDAASPNDSQIRFALPLDTFVPGDWDGDGATDLSVTRFEGASLAWYHLPSSNQSIVRRLAWGRANLDLEVQGDFDGDGKTDYAIWRASPGGQGTYFILRSSDSVVQYQIWGLFGDVLGNQDTHNQ